MSWKRLLIVGKTLSALIALIASAASILYLHLNGYRWDSKYPFIWRDSDQHSHVHATCNTLMALGLGIRQATDDSLDLGSLESIEKTVEILQRHYSDFDDRTLTAGFWAKDAWQNSLKIRSEVRPSGKIILIYSDTPNEFRVLPEGYNLFVRVVIHPDKTTSMTVTQLNTGRIVLAEY